MRELIIRCDHCGEIIEGNTYKIYIEEIDRETEDITSVSSKEHKEVRRMDWCENCIGNLTAFLLDTSHQLLVTPPTLQEPVPDPEIPDGGGNEEKSKNRYWKAKSII